MGTTRNVVLSVIAAGALIVGLLVLIPEPAGAVKPGAPTVTLSGSGSTITTTVTSVVTIPAGQLVPLEYAEVIFADGTVTPTFGGGLSRMDNPIRTCVGQVSSWAGATQTHGTFKGTGYSIIVEPSYGYGYTFGSAGSDLLGSYGTGYGYGSEGSDVTVTVTVTLTNCPLAADFGGNTFRTFHVQLMVGGGATTVFAGLPATTTLRNPLVAFPTATSGNTDTTPEFNVQVTGAGPESPQTTYTLQIQAGTTVGGSDGSDYASGTFTFTPDPDQIDAATFLQSAVFTTNQAIPDGANIVLGFMDQDTAGGTFAAGAGGFSVPGADLSTRTGGTPAAGFFQITMNGLPAGSSPGAFLDVTMNLLVPQSYFTGTRTTANFHLERYSDAGAYVGVVQCSFLGAVGTDNRFSCTITDFSSFAMVASAFSVGGGGGGGAATTTTTSGTSTGTQTGTQTGTGTDTQTGTGTDTQTGTGTGTSTSKGPGRGGSAPGLEFGLLVAALAGIALLARRRLK